MISIKIGLAIFSTVLFIAACSVDKPANTAILTNNSNAPASIQPTASIDELASGRKVFEQNCAICHRAEGTGGEIEIEGKKLDPDDLTSEKVEKFSDEKIIRYIVNGVVDEGMPAFKDKLSEGEIRDVVKYIRTQFHKK